MVKIRPAGDDDRKPWHTDEYVIYLQSETWAAIRTAALERAGHRCEWFLNLDERIRCEETRNLQVHHRRYVALGYEQPEDLAVLCAAHHKKADSRRRNAKREKTLQRRYGNWRPSR